MLEESILSDDLDSLYHLTTDDETVITSNMSSHQNIIHYDSFTPIIWVVDKPSSSLPSVMTFSEDFIKSCVGFRKIDMLKCHFHTLYQPSIKLGNTPADGVLDLGNLATMKKKPQSTTPVVHPLYFADVIHMDIFFGLEISVGNIHYGLLFTDQYSRMTYLYPLHNLTTDIPKQLKAFFTHISHPPTCLITDFDLKLIGGKAREFLNNKLIHCDNTSIL